ncbi:RNA polymerase sigma factor [Sorangium sp. So ce124]|uniref:RNA polymerase sigma factor n=1 Tax=Sorangium sp. So ce124 TaxID=3133280 RepID=UPI003F633269
MSVRLTEGSRAHQAEGPLVSSIDLERTRRAGAGDPAAQAWLVARLLPGVRQVAQAFLRRSADADDAAQLATLAILRAAPAYRGEAAIEGWARRIAVRTVLRYLRAVRRRDAPIAGDLSDAEEVPASSRGSAQEALPRHVRDYLGELPEAQREALILHHALEHTVDEIAEMTDVSPDTVRSRLRLGIAALRKRVRQDIAVGRRRSP